jgi:hypothetical protein
VRILNKVYMGLRATLISRQNQNRHFFRGVFELSLSLPPSQDYHQFRGEGFHDWVSAQDSSARWDRSIANYYYYCPNDYGLLKWCLNFFSKDSLQTKQFNSSSISESTVDLSGSRWRFLWIYYHCPHFNFPWRN